MVKDIKMAIVILTTVFIALAVSYKLTVSHHRDLADDLNSVFSAYLSRQLK